jgi:hypothetical protein
VNRRTRCRSPIPSRPASSPTFAFAPSSAPLQIRRRPRATVVREPFQVGENGAVSGRQRRQGRNPAASAAAADGKNRTLPDCAGAPGTPGTPGDNKRRWCEHQYRTTHHKPHLVPAWHDRIGLHQAFRCDLLHHTAHWRVRFRRACARCTALCVARFCGSGEHATEARPMADDAFIPSDASPKHIIGSALP